MQTVLFHLGRLEQLPTRDNGRSGGRDADWQRITERAPVLAATMSDYLDQMSVRLRPNSRATIEKSWLAARPGHRGTTWPPRPSAGGSGRWRRSSSGSTSSTSRTRRRVHRSCAPICRSRTTLYPASSTTQPRRSCSPPPAPTPTRSPASRSSCSPAPAYVKANYSTSASCSPTVTFRCIPSSRPCSTSV